MRTQTILAIAGATALTGLVGQAIYFDHCRQTDRKFRKKLEQENKKLAKSAKANEDSATGARKRRLEEAVKQVVLPAGGVREREAFFTQCVGEAEALFALGPAHHFDASVHFYKALKVFPDTMELVDIYRKTVPPEVFDMIMELVATDARLNGGESAAAPGGLAGAAAGAPTRTAASLDEVDDDSPSGGAPAGPSAGASPVSQPVSSSASGEYEASSQEEGNRGPPSTYSSQEGNGIASGYSSNPEGSATGGNASAYSSQEWEKVSSSSGSATVGAPSTSNEGINLPDVASAPVNLGSAPAPAASATGTAAGNEDTNNETPAPLATSTADVFSSAPAPEATEQATVKAQEDIFAGVQEAAQDASATTSQAPQ